MATSTDTSSAEDVYAALRRSTEGRDASALVDLVADDAVVTVYDKHNPPGNPRILTGKESIRSYLEDVASRDLSHRLSDEVVGGDRIAFNEHCEYPDGLKVVASHFYRLEGGKIAAATLQQTWDE